MSENKSFWARLKSWVDGDEVIINADEYISTRENKDRVIGEKSLGANHAPAETLRANSTLYRILCVAITVCFIVVMMGVVMDLPMFGDPGSITNNEVAARYLEKGIEETGAINFVAGMILDYRAFDTLGESFVLFTSVTCVMLLLENFQDEDEPKIERIKLFKDIVLLGKRNKFNLKFRISHILVQWKHRTMDVFVWEFFQILVYTTACQSHHPISTDIIESFSKITQLHHDNISFQWIDT